MVTTEALKLLYRKLGGSADVESITSISDMVDLIEDVAGSGGGGGASGLVALVTWDDSGFATLDKSYTEIVAAIESGVQPVVYDRAEYTSKGTDFVEHNVYTLLSCMDAGNAEYHVSIWQNQNVYDFKSDTATGVLTYDPLG